MFTHTWNLCSAFNPSKVHTHTHTAVNTHPEQWAAIYAAAPGEQLGFWCLAQGHFSRGIEGGESTVHLQFLPDKSNSLTIRPRLPLLYLINPFSPPDFVGGPFYTGSDAKYIFV